MRWMRQCSSLSWRRWKVFRKDLQFSSISRKKTCGTNECMGIHPQWKLWMNLPSIINNSTTVLLEIPQIESQTLVKSKEIWWWHVTSDMDFRDLPKLEFLKWYYDDSTAFKLRPLPKWRWKELLFEPTNPVEEVKRLFHFWTGQNKHSDWRWQQMLCFKHHCSWYYNIYQ